MLQSKLQRNVLALLCLACVMVSATSPPRCRITPAIVGGVFPAACFNARPGTNCTATCFFGFRSEPAPITTCNSDGTWSAPVGACQRVCQGMPLRQISGNTWPTSCNSRVRAGRWCEGQCAQGMVGSPRVFCARGRWTALSITRGSCQPAPPTVTCSSKPPSVTNGVFPDSCINTPVGSSCTAECTPGFNHTGSPVAVCLAGGNWSVPVSPAACEQVPTVPGGGGGTPGTGDEGGEGAALPTDLVISSTPCQAGLPPGSTASVTFNVTSNLNPEQLNGVALQLTFPTALWPDVALACQTAAGTALPCDFAPFTEDDLAQSLLSVGCMLGNMQDISSATCTVSYTTPATAEAHATLASSGDNFIMGAVTHDTLLPNVVEFEDNNGAVSCAVSA